MHLKIFNFIGLIVTSFFACQDEHPKQMTYETKARKTEISNPVIIDIQPFSNIDKSQVEYVYTEINKTYPHIIILDAIPLPEESFYAPRNRYRADSLISYLLEIPFK